MDDHREGTQMKYCMKTRTKICKDCNAIKPFVDFYAAPSKSGCHSYCKTCHKIRAIASAKRLYRKKKPTSITETGLQIHLHIGESNEKNKTEQSRGELNQGNRQAMELQLERELFRLGRLLQGLRLKGETITKTTNRSMEVEGLQEEWR